MWVAVFSLETNNLPESGTLLKRSEIWLFPREKQLVARPEEGFRVCV